MLQDVVVQEKLKTDLVDVLLRDLRKRHTDLFQNQTQVTRLITHLADRYQQLQLVFVKLDFLVQLLDYARQLIAERLAIVLLKLVEILDHLKWLPCSTK